ncbi:MAG TPA: hypothetical protein VGG65_09630 [Thermoanaerobaculia bacterium]
MRTTTARSVRAVLLALRMSLAGAAALQAVNLPDLSGTWQLNKDASDDAAKVMKDARAAGGGGGGGGGGMGGGHHGHGGGGGGGRGAGRGQDDSASQNAGDWFAALNTLQIKHKEPELSITDASGRVRVVYTDGRKTEEERSHGGTTAVTGSWKDGHVEIVSKPETGAKITEDFIITADGSQLTVTTKMEGGRGPAVTIHRVYDAVKSPVAPTPPPAPPGAYQPGGADDEEFVSARR